MRATGLFFITLALAAFIGCGDGDRDPVSSTPEEGLAAPAAKLTVSRTPAGGLRPGMQKLTGTFQAANAATNDGPSQGCPAEWTLRDLAGGGELTVLGNFTVEGSHCAAPNRLSFKNGEIVFTTAVGDDLHGTYEGTVAVGAGIEVNGSPAAPAASSAPPVTSTSTAP